MTKEQCHKMVEEIFHTVESNKVKFEEVVIRATKPDWVVVRAKCTIRLAHNMSTNTSVDAG